MAKKMGYYNVEAFARQKKQQEQEIVVPPRPNFLAAAKHLRTLFDSKKFTYAFMGGLEMLCLGHRREMPDLQIAYDDRDFNRMKAKLEADPRVQLPEGINSLFPAKILVRTGPAYKDDDCTAAGDIEVDLIPPGCYGTPRAGDLADSLVLLSLKVEGKLRTYKGLNMTYLVRTLVQYCKLGDLTWDPRMDILFLCQEYSEEVSMIRSQLDHKAVQQNFFATTYFARLSPDVQRKCYQVLLGTEPPPVMATTPRAPAAVNKHSASTPDAASKPRVSSHNPSPSIQGQPAPSHLGPVNPGKPSISHRVSSNDAVTMGYAPPNAFQSIQTRDSRSRYRQTTSRSSRDVSPLDAQHPANVRHSRQQPNGFYQNPSHGAQVARSPVSPPASQIARTMQNLNVRQSAPILPHPFAQTALVTGPGRLSQGPHTYIAPVEMSASPVVANPCQQHIKSQFEMAPSMPMQHRDNQNPIINRSLVPLAVDIQQQQRVELPASTTPQPRTNQLRIVNPDEQPKPAVQPDNITAPQFPTLPIELDAMSELGHFIAELSVDRRTPAPLSDYESMIPPPLHPHSKPSLQTSPVISATRPLNPRTSSAPVPAALLPGHFISHEQTPSISPPTSSSGFDLSPPSTNAARYTQYFTPPPSTSGSPQPAYQAYKAYQPAPALVLPPSPPTVFVDKEDECTPDTATPDRESRFARLRDVDGKEGYGKRVSRSVDSRVLAREYRAELPRFGEGYGSFPG